MWQAKSNEPIQSTVRAWVKFLSDSSNLMYPTCNPSPFPPRSLALLPWPISRHEWQRFRASHDRSTPPPPWAPGGGCGPGRFPLDRPFLRQRTLFYSVFAATCLLDQIRHSDSQQQVRRVTHLAAITSTLTMSLCDLLFRFMSGQAERYFQRHHSISLQAVDIINDLCAQPDALQELGFSPEHCRIAARQLGVFTGFGGLQHCTPDRIDLGQPFPQLNGDRESPSQAFMWHDQSHR
jgi:hypothetical protein